jgi:hypothetical protein
MRKEQDVYYVPFARCLTENETPICNIQPINSDTTNKKIDSEELWEKCLTCHRIVVS